MPFTQVIVLALAVAGVAFIFVSAIGILRLPDVYARMHAAGKASTVGVSFVLIAAGMYFGHWEALRMAILVALFLITGPIATTSMARAAYRTDLRRRLILHYDEWEEARAARKAVDLHPESGVERNL